MSSSPDPNALAIERLTRANPSHNCPILLLGLDGIDEVMQPAGEWNASAGRLINFFWLLHRKHLAAGTVPPVRLIVTCRRAEDINHLITPVNGIVPNDVVPFVPLGDFSSQELEVLAQQLNHTGVIRLLLDNGVSTGPPGNTFSTSTLLQTSSEVIPLLRRPIIWRFFCSLDSSEQLDVLRGDDSGLRSIARELIVWHATRTRQRHGIDVEAVQDTLRAAAQRANRVKGPFKFKTWQDAATGVGLTGDQPRRLFFESIAAGILNDLPPSGNAVTARSVFYNWQWQHEFVLEYLLRGSR